MAKWNLKGIDSVRSTCFNLDGSPSQKTNAIIWYSYMLGMPDIKNVQYATEFTKRIQAWENRYGYPCGSKMTAEMVLSYIGLVTDAPKKTWSEVRKEWDLPVRARGPRQQRTAVPPAPPLSVDDIQRLLNRITSPPSPLLQDFIDANPSPPRLSLQDFIDANPSLRPATDADLPLPSRSDADEIPF